ncbi:MAG TPA: hypothetical protein DGC76_04135, partial [Candidatus Accumulibacter sp.]|nr:hypothetical protein [Accumulibacter sp.]
VGVHCLSCTHRQQPLTEFIMKTNVGGIDKLLRIVVGIVLIAMAALGIIGAWGWIGVVPLLTGLFGVCPAYSLLGMNTCPIRKTS